MLLQRPSLKSSLNWLRALLLTAIFVSLCAGAQAQVPVVENDHTFKANDSSPARPDITLTKPLEWAVGDLFLVFVASDSDQGPEWNVKTDWNLIVNVGSNGPNAVAGIYWKIADGTEGSTETFTQDNDDDLLGGGSGFRVLTLMTRYIKSVVSVRIQGPTTIFWAILRPKMMSWLCGFWLLMGLILLMQGGA